MDVIERSGTLLLNLISTPFTLPPQQNLELLLEAAKGGYVTDIRNILDRLKTSEAGFEPFALKIDNLVKSFQFREIIELITSTLNQEMKP